MVQLTYRKLRLLNAAVGVWQLLCGIGILVITNYDASGKLPWYSFFIGSWSRDNADAAQFYIPQPKQVAAFPIGVWSGVFLLLSAADHLLVVLPGVNRHYNRQLCRNRNPFRWAEYAVSAALMQVMMGQLCGITDVHLLFAIFALMATTMLFGWHMEVSNGERLPCFEHTDDSRAPPRQLSDTFKAMPFIADGGSASAAGFALADAEPARRIDWTPFWFGFWPFAASVAIVACFFFQAVSHGDPPSFVWSLIFIISALYLMFAVNQWLQFKQMRGWRGFGKAEFWYIILSLTSKQLLAWVTYGGTKRFDD